MQPKHTCPECHLNFEAEISETGVLACPLCNTVFSTLALSRSVPTLPSPLSAASSGRHVLRGVLAVGTVLLLVGGSGYAYHLLGGLDRKPAALPVPPACTPPAPASPCPVEVIPIHPAEPMPPATVRQPQPSLKAPELQPLAIAKEEPQPLTLPERVNRAIERGVAYLRSPNEGHNHDRRSFGLIGLTLLECGIPADDLFVRQLAASIRAGERDLTQTYDLTLAILFLDRLGDPSDRTLIRTFGQRLMFGQFACGAWSYSCLISDRQRVWGNLRQNNLPTRQRISYRGDNSNTQFAILGLWVAQRYGVPVRPALLAAEQYFRATQAEDGSWSYHARGGNSRDSMTCAGLMSLAMRHGAIAGQGYDIRPDHPLSVHDAAVLRGLRYLAQSLDKINVVGNRIVGAEARDPLYFLWSLERMAVIYGLKKIGEREWYPWAAQMLVETQWPDGRWAGMRDPVGTCFALLVLKRSNFAKDLQLAVQEPPSPAMSDVSGPTILQGPDAFLGQTGKPHRPTAPLGPSISHTPQTK